jgi:ABC-type branched-subunit amino acid transport system permease subunit
MSGLRRVLHPILIAAVVFAVLPFALPRFGSAGTLATEIAIYTLYAMGFNLLLGYTGLSVLQLPVEPKTGLESEAQRRAATVS